MRKSIQPCTLSFDTQPPKEAMFTSVLEKDSYVKWEAGFTRKEQCALWTAISPSERQDAKLALASARWRAYMHWANKLPTSPFSSA